MAGIFTPTNQKRLTNIAIVRLKKGGKRFEIACYPNKVTSWRDKIETDINEVLQTKMVFLNVSKGQVANNVELKNSFGTDNIQEICLLILSKGELQVSEKERKANMESTFREVSTIIADKCVNPDTERPYPVTMIEKALKDVHFCIKPNKSGKQLALEAIKLLKASENIKIRRAEMRIRISAPAKEGKAMREKVKKFASTVEQDVCADSLEIICLIDPGVLREVSQLVEKESRGRGHVEIINLKDVRDEDEEQQLE